MDRQPRSMADRAAQAEVLKRVFGSGEGIGALLSQRLQRAIQALEESDARTSALGTLETSRHKQREIRMQLGQANGELRKLLAGPEPDKTAVLAQVDRTGALQTELRKQEISAMLEIRAHLGPERMEQVRTKMREAGMAMRAEQTTTQ